MRIGDTRMCVGAAIAFAPRLVIFFAWLFGERDTLQWAGVISRRREFRYYSEAYP